MHNPETTPLIPSVYHIGHLVDFLTPTEATKAISALPISVQSDIYQAFRNQAEELGQLTQPDLDPTIFHKQMIEQGRYQFIQPREGLPLQTLTRADYRQVLTSRNFPLFSQAELQHIRDTKFAFFGLSTGLASAVGLAQLGAEHFDGVDPDLINLSNLNRIYGATIYQVGQPKAYHAGRILGGINPYIDLTLHPRSLSPAEIERMVKSADIVIEMIDDLSTKRGLRQTAKEFGKPYVSGTNTDWLSIISVETPSDPLFGKNLSPETITFLDRPTQGPEAYRAIIDIVGPEKISTRQMINLNLHALHPEARYLAQHGPNASINGGAMVRAITAVVCGYPLNHQAMITIEPLMNIKPDNSLLLQELKQRYPEFAPFTSLDQAAIQLTRQLFDLNWSPS